MRRLPIPALVAALALSACLGGAPELDDPREIMTGSVEAMAEVSSVGFDLALDGRFTVPEMGGAISLDGTSMSGSFDLEANVGELSFSVPALLGLAGEAVMTADAAYLRTTLTGDLWSREELDPEDALATVSDPEEALAELNAFLDREGVEVRKLDDVPCVDPAEGEEPSGPTCYHVEIVVPAEVIAESDEAAEADPELLAMLGDGLTLDLRFAKETLYVMRFATGISAEEGELAVTLTMRDYNEPVDVVPPPSDQVTEDGGFTFP